MRKQILSALLCIASSAAYSQHEPAKDSANGWSIHFQMTAISQKHGAFYSLYSGANSLADSAEPVATSLTSTLFIGRSLWKGAAIYVNPELSGGSGLSFTKGVAGALNGETYRVGETAPEPFVARAFIQQHIALKRGESEWQEDDFNQVGEMIPADRLTISAGMFAISDFFDDNPYSKDPRSQFFNWSIWANGAWDYPANTRGYTQGLVVEWIQPRWTFRVSTVAVPRIANFHLMEYNSNAHSETIEVEHRYAIKGKAGSVRLIASHTMSQAPSYTDGLTAIAEADSFLLNVISGQEEHKQYGGKKSGIFINADQQVGTDIGVFARIGWNDGKYVSWSFTEIDETVNAGLSLRGRKWKRPDDVFGLAFVVNGISNEHRDFLAAGGYGFIIGDGKLSRYGTEQILETYYNARLARFLWATLDYQFLNHPAYNMDRGPVHVFAVRVHVEI